MSTQRVITALWKGVVAWGQSASTILQSSTEKYLTSFQDSRGSHPPQGGSCPQFMELIARGDTKMG